LAGSDRDESPDGGAVVFKSFMQYPKKSQIVNDIRCRCGAYHDNSHFERHIILNDFRHSTETRNDMTIG
ncbi:MAG: hypothetical protein KDJ31_09520, partial [Candidatus Competibacteraceae bacterium]|nr:hypothetical protein [Candidatus Competibacteraceae bacterium]